MIKQQLLKLNESILHLEFFSFLSLELNSIYNYLLLVLSLQQLTSHPEVPDSVADV